MTSGLSLQLAGLLLLLLSVRLLLQSTDASASRNAALVVLAQADENHTYKAGQMVFVSRRAMPAF
jgi:hypothetical protein